MYIPYLKRIDYVNDGRPSSVIKRKLSECNGLSACKMLKGDPIQIYLTKDGVVFASFENLVCEWEIIDAIVFKTRQLGGKMYRGDSAAHNGAKIGSPELPLDTIDSFISLYYYNNKIGNSTLRRSTYYSALLAWAGICENHRSKGEGGYITLK